MSPHTIHRNGQRPLQIEGTIVAKSYGHQHVGTGHNRYHEITVFKLHNASYFVYIQYFTHWKGETPFYYHSVQPTLSDVASALESFDPTPHVEGFQKFGDKEPYATRQQQLLSDITRRYHVQVADICEQLGIVEEL